MIIQCMECQTRFRMADEKIKPTGTKVRCSKCKHIFTVHPPESEPEPVEESVDFGEFNMEKVDDTAAPSEPPSPEGDDDQETAQTDSAPAEEQADASAADEVDFSGLEAEMGADSAAGGELADEFSFADTSQSSGDDKAETQDAATGEAMESVTFDFGEEETPAAPETTETDFDAAFAESEESASLEPSPDETTEEQGPSDEVSFAEESGPTEFDFGEETGESADVEAAGEFSFEDEDDGQAISFDDVSGSTEFADQSEDDSDLNFDEEESGPAEYSFDDEPSFESDSSDWDDSGDEAPSFDFDEPQFETEAASEPESEPESGGGDLQFGEIDFSDDAGDETPGIGGDDDFAGATLASQQDTAPEPAPMQETRWEPAERKERDEAPLPAPKKTKRKGSLSRVLSLLFLLFLVLAGAAGYFFWQDGGFDLNRIVQRFPFLQPYLGQPAEVAEAPRIGINISSSSYVKNKEAGQLLVIQGEAVNNYPQARSAITIKGVLLDDQGKTLLQQTVFCGNPMTEKNLETLPFASIEESMNNQFGDSLSNMNVAANARIPFTVVFRNLPEGIANINIEVVDSKPGSG